MASRYYNPRLASSLGAAKSNIPVNAAGAFERGFMPVFQRGVQIKQKEERERVAALQKIAERKRKLREDVANEYKRFMFNVVEKVPPQHSELTNQMMQIGKKVFQTAATIEDPIERAEYQSLALKPAAQLSQFYQNEKETSKNAAAIIENNLMSKANQFDSDGYEIAMKRYKGDYKPFYDSNLGEFVCEFDIDGEKVNILAEDLEKYNILPKASEAIKNNNDNELAFIKYIETQKIFPDHPAFNDILNSYLDKFEINSSAEAVSILVDHFKIAGKKDAELQQNLKKLEAVLDPYSKSGIRKNEEDNFIYEDIDEEGNKTNEILTGEEAIIEMAKDQYTKILRSAATNLGSYYTDKSSTDSGLTQTQKYNEQKAAERGDMLIKKLNEGIKSFITSISPSTEFRDINGLVTLLSRDKDGNIVEGQRYNTNSIEGREAFLNDFARAKYGSDAQFDLIQDYIAKTLRNTMSEQTGPKPSVSKVIPPHLR